MLRLMQELTAARVQWSRHWLALFAVLWCGMFFASASHAQDYRLGAGDVIRVTVFGHTDLGAVVRINESGKSSLPLIGEVQLGGSTLADAEAEISRKLTLGGFVNQAQVTINVDQFGSQQVAVLGMVSKPGQFVIERETTVVDMIAKAGGLSPEAHDVVNVIKTRKGKAEVTYVDLVAMLQSGDLKGNVSVGSGDVIFVPRADVFYIYGEVQRPGRYRLERNMTLMQALAVGGGVTPKGSERHVKINRRQANGETASMNAGARDQLQGDDVIYVESSLF